MSGLNSLLSRNLNPFPLEYAAEELGTTKHKLLTQAIAGRRDVYAAISGSYLVHRYFDITQAETMEIGKHVGEIITQRERNDLFSKLSLSDLRRLNRYDRALLSTVEIGKGQAISAGNYQFVDMDFEDMCWIEGNYEITVKDLYLLGKLKNSPARVDAVEKKELAIRLLCELLAKRSQNSFQINGRPNISKIHEALKELADSFNIGDNLIHYSTFCKILGRSKGHL